MVLIILAFKDQSCVKYCVWLTFISFFYFINLLYHATLLYHDFDIEDSEFIVRVVTVHSLQCIYTMSQWDYVFHLVAYLKLLQAGPSIFQSGLPVIGTLNLNSQNTVKIHNSS